jgi:hypothetical protein
MSNSTQGRYQTFTTDPVTEPQPNRFKKRLVLIPLVLVALLAGGGIAAWQVTKMMGAKGFYFPPCNVLHLLKRAVRLYIATATNTSLAKTFCPLVHCHCNQYFTC